MAEGNQSKEGLFELLFSSLKMQGLFSGDAHRTATALIDNVIPDSEREKTPEEFKKYMLQLGISIANVAMKL